MNDYGIWTVITPLVTIGLAIYTRQVILSLLAGIFVGFTVIANFNPLKGITDTLEGIINIYASSGNTKTILFCFMVGGIIRLIQVTGGTRGLVRWLTEKANLIKSKRAVQLLAMLISMLIFIESSISEMSAGTVTNDLAKRYKVSREKMAYIIQASTCSSCSSVMINGWGAAMMAVIGTQITAGLITGEPFAILAGSMVYNLMAWGSIASVLYYIMSGKDWGPMKEAEQRVQSGQSLRKNAMPISGDDHEIQVIDHPASGSAINFFLPLLTTIIMVPIGLLITGEGNIAAGSGSTSVFWGVMAGTSVSLIYFVGRGIMGIEEFFRHIFAGFGTMIPLGAVMTLAFLMGNVSGELNTGAYISQTMDGFIPAGFSAAFLFVIAAIMSLATGTSWGTFSIMIPIGIQIGLAVGIDLQLMIGAAISGAIFGDMTSPISDTSMVASMATNNDHIDHIRTQLPYSLLTGGVVCILYVILGHLLSHS